MSFLNEVTQELRGMLGPTDEDGAVEWCDSVVEFVSGKLRESYWNGFNKGRNGNTTGKPANRNRRRKRE